MFNVAYKAYNNLVIPNKDDKESAAPPKSGLLARSKEAMPVQRMAKSEYERVASYVSTIRNRREALKSDGK